MVYNTMPMTQVIQINRTTNKETKWTNKGKKTIKGNRKNSSLFRLLLNKVDQVT